MKSIDDFVRAGYGAELVLVCPPRVSGTIPRADQGKAPAVLNPSRGWVGDRDWRTRAVTQAVLDEWRAVERSGPINLGLRAARYPAIDIDVIDPIAVGKITALAHRHLGYSPSRVGNPPKSLLAYALAPGAPEFLKNKITLGRLGAVELLADGQQYLVAGTHATTLQPYQWSAPMPAAASLPTIDAPMLLAFWRALSELARTEGWEFKGVVSAATRSDAPPALPALAAPTSPASEAAVSLYRDALMAVGNTASYDEWIAVGAGLCAALGDAGAGLFAEWSALYPGNTPSEISKRWRSFKPPFTVDGHWVMEWCRARGYASTVTTTQAVISVLGVTPICGNGGQPPSPAPVTARRAVKKVKTEAPIPVPGSDGTKLPEWIADWVYVTAVEQFIHLPTAHEVSERVAARLWSYPTVGPDHKDNPAKLWFQSPLRQIYHRLTFEPGCPPIVDGAVNTWREPEGLRRALDSVDGMTVPDVIVQPYIDHVASIVPDKKERDTLLDWMSYVVQYPKTKPNWAVFLGSPKEGIGKDLLFKPMYHACGKEYTRTIRPQSVVSDFSEWLDRARFIVVEEMRAFTGGDALNNLKMLITRPPEMVPINRKGVSQYEVPNVACFVFMSNYINALPVGPDDRRYFVLWSHAAPKPQSYSVPFAKWMDAHMDLIVAWLATRAISVGFDPWRAPWTEAKATMVDASRGEFDAVFVELWRSGLHPFHHELATTTALWDALPDHVKRTRNASIQRMVSLLEQQGAVRITTAAGKERRIDLDHGHGAPAFGRSVVYAMANPARWLAATSDQIRGEFRRTWAPNSVIAAVSAPAPKTFYQFSGNSALTAPSTSGKI